MTRSRLAALLAAALALGACAQNAERGAPSARPSPEASAPPAPSSAAAEGPMIHFRAPEEWTPATPTSPMRVLQYRLPGGEGQGEAEVVVFFFGAGQGGSVEANLERWKGQFTRSDGSPAAADARVERAEYGGFPAALLDISGTYDPGSMMGGGPRPGTRMRTAVLETPLGNYFVRLLGPAATVERWSASFDAFLRSVHLPE